MIFNRNLYLSNCDSVKQLDQSELKKRFLLGLTFAEHVILTPNILLDNKSFWNIMNKYHIERYLSEEGENKLILRGFGVKDIDSFSDYFDNLKGSYKLSCFNGKSKDKLTKNEIKEYKKYLKNLDTTFRKFKLNKEEISNKSITKEIYKRLESDNDFLNENNKEFFYKKTKYFNSRSEWYEFSDIFFQNNSKNFKFEVINPAYYSLFVNKDELFCEDDIKFLSGIPNIILDGSIFYKSLKDEYELIKTTIDIIGYGIKIFKIIHNGGIDELLKILSKELQDEVKSYILNKIEERGYESFQSKNWFGLYPLLMKKIGVEIKNE